MLKTVRRYLDGLDEEPVATVQVDSETNSSRDAVSTVYLASYLARAEVIRENDTRPFRPVDASKRIAESMYEKGDGEVRAYDQKAAEIAETVRHLYDENPSMSIESFVRRTVEEMTE